MDRGGPADTHFRYGNHRDGWCGLHTRAERVGSVSDFPVHTLENPYNRLCQSYFSAHVVGINRVTHRFTYPTWAGERGGGRLGILDTRPLRGSWGAVVDIHGSLGPGVTCVLFIFVEVNYLDIR